MTGISDEATLRGNEIVELVGHLVERRRQCADLGRRVRHIGTRMEITAAEVESVVLEALQRVDRPPGQALAHEDREREDAGRDHEENHPELVDAAVRSDLGGR